MLLSKYSLNLCEMKSCPWSRLPTWLFVVYSQDLYIGKHCNSPAAELQGSCSLNLLCKSKLSSWLTSWSKNEHFTPMAEVYTVLNQQWVHFQLKSASVRCTGQFLLLLSNKIESKITLTGLYIKFVFKEKKPTNQNKTQTPPQPTTIKTTTT